jgi:hypothetical protein
VIIELAWITSSTSYADTMTKSFVQKTLPLRNAMTTNLVSVTRSGWVQRDNEWETSSLRSRRRASRKFPEDIYIRCKSQRASVTTALKMWTHRSRDGAYSSLYGPMKAVNVFEVCNLVYITLDLFGTVTCRPSLRLWWNLQRRHLDFARVTECYFDSQNHKTPARLQSSMQKCSE